MTAPGAHDWAAGMASQRKAEQWFARSNPVTFVGSKHHTVPAVTLRRFAASGKRLSIWRWPDRQIRPGSVSDLAIKNFYTSLNTDGQFDGRVEEVLGQVETAAAPVIDWLLSPFRGRKLTPERHADLCALIFCPVLGEEYVPKIVQDGNVRCRYVTCFLVRRSFLDRHEVHRAGGQTILEYWLPAEDLAALNASIVGTIELAELQRMVLKVGGTLIRRVDVVCISAPGGIT
jgi:hypothetical protein